MPHRAARILLAEDDPSFGASVERLLRLAGHQVARAHDGREALDRLAAEGLAFDLVLTDLLMPRMTGFDIVREARAIGMEVPILVMTGVYARTREIATLRALGVSGYVHKDAPLDHLLFRVNAILYPSQASLRRSERAAVSVPVQYPGRDGRCWATTFNVSEGGVYVRTPDPPPQGDAVDLVLALPTSREPVRVRAEVVHVATSEATEGTGYPAGFGARFLEPSPLALSAIRMLVQRVLEDERTGAAIAADAGERAESPVFAQTCS